MQYILLYFIGLPRPAPVTTATLPSNLKTDIASLAAVIDRAARNSIYLHFQNYFLNVLIEYLQQVAKIVGGAHPIDFFFFDG